MNLAPVRSILVPLTWTTITHSDDQAWCFRVGGGISKDLLRIISGPRIYRFCFAPEDTGFPWIYVGQSERFERRCADYLRALSRQRKQPQMEFTIDTLGEAWKEMEGNSCVRIAARIQNAERAGTGVELQLLSFEEFYFNGVLISPDSLGSPFVRCLVENLAILDTDRPGVHLMNQGRRLEVKVFGALLERERATPRAT